MKVRIVKPWICGGRNPEVGSVIELPDDLAESGIRRELCEAVRQNKSKPRSKAAKTADRKSRT
ncbi:MAG: hypothetical protein U9P14_12300 [Gemmatimonadota bacterium]|nr:hypothetical protein [Gemmatimonadota bacterium]